MSLIDDVVGLLEAEDLGEFGSDLHAGNMPDVPDALTALYETPPAGPTFTKQGMARDSARLQVLCRAQWYDGAMAKAVTIHDLLKHHRWEVGDVEYRARSLQRPFDVGAQDAQGRTVVSANYSVAIYRIPPQL